MKRPLAALLVALGLALAAGAAAPRPAAAATNLFENTSDAKAFLKRVKRDLFGLRRAEVVPQAAAATAEVALPAAPEVVKPPAPATEDFRVEGIIRIGERGCAIVNAKTWYVGKTNLGYRLEKLYDDKVEIKAPDGRTLTCNLIREQTAGPAFGE